MSAVLCTVAGPHTDLILHVICYQLVLENYTSSSDIFIPGSGVKLSPIQSKHMCCHGWEYNHMCYQVAI